VRLLLLLLLGIPTAASAAERKLFISSFERIRVEGPFRVTVATGRSPTGSVTAESRQLDRVEVRLEGTTLVVRSPIEKTAVSNPQPITVALGTPVLTGATVIGGGALTITGGKAPRLDLSVTGAGELTLTAANTEQANATVIGNGRIALAGRAGKARLLINGAGRIDAAALEAGELVVRVDGPGEALGRARYTASVTNAGLGRVAIAGTPKCTIKSAAGGPVTCGVERK
jgi:hypothetical protein